MNKEFINVENMKEFGMDLVQLVLWILTNQSPAVLEKLQFNTFYKYTHFIILAPPYPGVIFKKKIVPHHDAKGDLEIPVYVWLTSWMQLLGDR